MTTNVFDVNAGVMATDSRWSVPFGNKFVIYLDDAGFEKIEIREDHAYMFAGRGERVDEWKRWIASNPTGPAGQPGHAGMSVCMVNIPNKKVVFHANQTITNPVDNPVVYFAGTGTPAAFKCWSKNKNANKSVETAKAEDVYSGGEVKFLDVGNRSHNLYPVAKSITFAELCRHLYERGLVMKIEKENKQGVPFSLKEAAASNEELRGISAKILSGELKPVAPCDGMDREWTEEEKQKFNAALGEAFGWKK